MLALAALVVGCTATLPRLDLAAADHSKDGGAPASVMQYLPEPSPQPGPSPLPPPEPSH